MSKTSPYYNFGYDELSKLINDAYGENQDVRTIALAFGISTPEVWEMLVFSDYYNFGIEEE